MVETVGVEIVVVETIGVETVGVETVVQQVHEEHSTKQIEVVALLILKSFQKIN